MSDKCIECTSCGFENWQMTCWSCNAVLPVTKQVEELKAENERLREALHRINSATNSELGMVRLIAREALEGGDDE